MRRIFITMIHIEKIGIGMFLYYFVQSTIRNMVICHHTRINKQLKYVQVK